jgi:hypothetical protein
VSLASVAGPSRTVRAILRLEARARRLLARYERALTAATRAKGQAHVLLDEADGLERALNGDQLRELHHARAQAAAGATPATDGGPA